MNRSLRISVADDEPDMREYFRKMLSHLGHEVVSAACHGRELIEQCRKFQPDLVITDIVMPELDGIEAASQLYQERPVPIIVVSGHHDAEFVERAETAHILAYLVKPIKLTDLQPAIGIAVRRFEQFQALHQEAHDLRQALEDRKLIEKAKGILMKRADLDEQQAFRRLQKLASEKNRKLVDIAHAIITAEEAMM